MSHKFGSHLVVLGRFMDLVKNPCLHFATYNKLEVNQYQSRRTTLVPIPLMRKIEVKLHIFSYVFKLVAMSIMDWLSTLKHIKTPKILSWEISKSGICMELFKLGTWCKYFVVYAVVVEKVKCYLYLVIRKWTKR